MDDLADAFWALVDKNGDCWFWMGKLFEDTYGSFTFGHREYRTHRLAYELAVGPIPQGLLVCHTCDNPPCVNPAHLWTGTQRDNIRDAMKKGRHHSSDRVVDVWGKERDRVRRLVEERRELAAIRGLTVQPD